MPEHEVIDWASLLVEKRDALGTIQSEATTPFDTEADFRAAFEILCDDYEQDDPQRLLASLLVPSGHIIAFAGGIDDGAGLQSPTSLTSILWSFEYNVVKSALIAKAKLPAVLRVFRKLKVAIPHFGPDLTRFSSKNSVQAPLQRIFSEYLSCCEMLISHFSTCPHPLEYEPVTFRFETATAIIKDAKKEWATAFEAATESEKRLLLTSSVPSVPNGLDGTSLRPQATNVHFHFLDHLGEGAYGRVSRVREAATGQVYARKLFQVKRDSRSQMSIATQVKDEVLIMQKLRHHHIASCLFYTQEVDAISIFMLPVADYDLKVFLDHECVDKGYPKATIRQLDQWVGCLLSALTFAHNQSIEHHDLKPNNVLIKDGQPYLADFGSAKDFSALESSKLADDLFAGTPTYYAPERRPWGRAADVFALGCVFSEMLTVRHNKSLADYREYRQSLESDSIYAFRNNLPKVVDWLTDIRPVTDALQLVIDKTINMLERDPNRRPEANKIKRWFRVEEDFLFCHTCS